MMRGFLTLWNSRGLAVRVHWTAPIGALFLCHFRFWPGAWLGIFVVVLVHELGHAAMVRASGAEVRDVVVHGAGGECSWQGDVTRLQRALIAWGGVFAQLILYVVAVVCIRVVRPSDEGMIGDFVYACTAYNLRLAALNLIPMRPLDGYEAFKIVFVLREMWRARAGAARRRKRSDARRQAVAELEALDRVELDDADADDVKKLLERTTRKGVR
jgi:Zn-dependent protease